MVVRGRKKSMFTRRWISCSMDHNPLLQTLLHAWRKTLSPTLPVTLTPLLYNSCGILSKKFQTGCEEDIILEGLRPLDYHQLLQLLLLLLLFLLLKSTRTPSPSLTIHPANLIRDGNCNRRRM